MARTETTVGFEVLPIDEVVAPVEVEVKVKGKKVKAKRGRGRPPVYNGQHRRIVAAALRHHGLTKGLEFLAKERNLKVSLTLARAVAKKEGITFTRGRPAKVA